MRSRVRIPAAIVALACLISSAAAVADQPAWFTQPGADVSANPRVTAQMLRVLRWKAQLDITLSQHARVRADRPEVRRYAQRLLRDHQLIEERLLGLAERLDLELRPPAAEEEAQAERIRQHIRQLRGLTGSSFEAEWLAMMASSHRTAIQQLARLRSEVQEPEARALVRNALSLSDQHLALTRTLQRQQPLGVLGVGPNTPLWIQILTQAGRSP